MYLFEHINNIIIKNKDSNFVIEYDPQNFEVEQILNIFHLHNIKIADISTRQPDLEEVFKYLIKSLTMYLAKTILVIIMIGIVICFSVYGKF